MCFASPRVAGVRRSRQAVPKLVNAASSGARPSQGDPTFELMAAEKRWEDSVGAPLARAYLHAMSCMY